MNRRDVALEDEDDDDDDEEDEVVSDSVVQSGYSSHPAG
jgi:hypothetical protein